MNTKFLMVSSALLMVITGTMLTFLPDEILKYIGDDPAGFNSLLLQILGALYFSFGLLNWTARGNLIGGIYSKPVAMGNFAHFFIGGITLLKEAVIIQDSFILWIAAVIYSIFAVLFALVAFRHPVKA